jgi:hypothetical protein
VSRLIVGTPRPDGIADMAASEFHLSIVAHNREKQDDSVEQRRGLTARRKAVKNDRIWRENKARRTHAGKMESMLWLPRSAPPFIQLSWESPL